MRSLTAAAVILLLMLIPAFAHDWYPLECCSGQDCRALSDAEVPQYVQPADGGKYLIVKWGIVVERKGYSPDNKFHICEMPTKFYCLFTPLPSGS